MVVLPKTVHALKEWSVAVTALEQGTLSLLLRKGGIQEAGRFTVPHTEVLLYPTYEHQRPDLLKPEYAQQVEAVESGWHPTDVRIGAWARITDVLEVSEDDRPAALLPFHIWNEAFVTERLRWKPGQPLSVLLLRVYRLPEPQRLLYEPSYGGCKSWIDLHTSIALDEQRPVLSDHAYAEHVVQIRAALTGPRVER